MNLMLYLLQVSACTGIFYAFYFLLLRWFTFFTLNRWYLLITLLVSFAIPTLTIPVEVPQAVAVVNTAVVDAAEFQPQVAQEVADQPLNASETAFNWVQLLNYVYWICALAFLGRLLYVLAVFVRKLKGSVLAQIGHVKVYNGSTPFINSSFLNVIFLNDEPLNSTDVKQVLAHELLHVKLWHSADRLMAQVAQIVLWFNPFIYAYQRSIAENHEFEVDQLATTRDNRDAYASLLLKLSLSQQSYLFQTFSKAPLKKRVMMLFNQPTPHMKKVIYLLVLPVVVLSCLAFAKFKSQPVNGVVKHSKQTDETSYVQRDNINAYRQKVKRNGKELSRSHYKGFENYTKTDDFKQKQAAMQKVSGKINRFKVIGLVDTTYSIFKLEGYKLLFNNQVYILNTRFGHEKQLQKKLHVGDEVDIEVRGCIIAQYLPPIISVRNVVRNNVTILKLTAADLMPQYPFLYEANRVRFTDGRITHVQKYANGKWRSAVVEVINGYKIKFNIKPQAPDFGHIDEGDQVRFRFVHEQKTGAKEYTVNDWVAISNQVKDYGVKNPDFFYKFYEKI